MILYRVNAKDKLIQWSIVKSENVISVKWGIVGGKQQTKTETIETNQSKRNIKQQVELKFNSMIKKQKDLGYKKSKKKAYQEKNLNASGMPLPMKAQIAKPPFDFYNHKKWIIQPKLNGHRCFIVNNGKKFKAYSKNGIRIKTINHILHNMSVKHFPKHKPFDGELYIHGESIQNIDSAITKKQRLSKKLIFICYDLVDDGDYTSRVWKVDTAFRMSIGGNFLGMWDYMYLMFSHPFYDKLKSPDNIEKTINDFLNWSESKGFEGLIFRNIKSKYQSGARSKNLLKLKKWFDNEYKILDVSHDANGCGKLHLKHEKRFFTVSACGNREERQDVDESYIGKWVNVKYPELTSKGVPFHAIATHYRTDHIK